MTESAALHVRRRAPCPADAVAPSTRALYAAFLRRFTVWRSAGRAARNEPRLRATVFGEADRLRLAEVATSPRDRALLAVLYVLRRSEAAGLPWADLDLDSGMVWVAQGKGGPGWTMLPPTAVDALRAWLGEAPPVAWVFARADRQGPVSGKTVAEWVDVLLHRAGLKRTWRGAHAFRRTFATEFLRTHPGAIHQLQVLMRHRSVSTTLLYDYVDAATLRVALGRVRL